MNIELSPDEVDFAVCMYMAIKGYKSEYRNYESHRKDGLQRVTCVNAKKIVPNIEGIINNIQNR